MKSVAIAILVAGLFIAGAIIGTSSKGEEPATPAPAVTIVQTPPPTWEPDPCGDDFACDYEP